MATRKKVTLKQLGPLFWRVGLVLLVLCAASLVAALWLSGRQDTQDAFESSRRLFIRLDDSTIQGKVISVNPSVAPTEEKPADVTAEPEKSHTDSPPDTIDDGVIIGGETVGGSLGDANVNVPSNSVSEGVNPLLIEKNKIGDLPMIGSDGTKPWRYYAKAYDLDPKKPMIAIIVTGLGQDKVVTDSAIKLYENITLSFSPYAKNIASWAAAARATGHEVLIDLPLEPSDYPATDPGPNALLTQKSIEANAENLRWVMSRLPVYVGLLTPQNEAYTSHGEDFKILLQTLANRGIMLIVGREPVKSETKEILASTNTAVLVVDALIDEELTTNAILTRLSTLERIAEKRGYAIGLAQSFPITIEQLKLWSQTLAAKGIILVPITTIAKPKFS